MEVEEELKKIKKEIRAKKIYQELDISDILSVHFGVGMYIRNKYLWYNPELVEILNQYFHTDNVDDLSIKILMEMKKEDAQSSNPNK